MNSERPNLSNETLSPEEKLEEVSLRPQNLAEYIGQKKLKEKLNIFIQAAKKREESLDHCLFSGPPGLGKTTLAHIIAREMEGQLKATTGPAIERPGDLAALLTNLEKGDVLFIDEIHRLSNAVEEVLYSAMEDFQLDIIIGQGPSARSIKLDLPRFTLVGATTRSGLLTGPLRDRFGVVARLEFYEDSELASIVSRSAKILDIAVTQEGALELARCSRKTPRIANRLLKRARDYAQVKADGLLDQKIAKAALELLEVDHLGLDPMDRRFLKTIVENFAGGPVGIETLSSALSEEKDTLEDVYEPFLIQCGFIKRTPRGRQATLKAYEYLGVAVPKNLETNEQGILF